MTAENVLLKIVRRLYSSSPQTDPEGNKMYGSISNHVDEPPRVLTGTCEAQNQSHQTRISASPFQAEIKSRQSTGEFQRNKINENKEAIEMPRLIPCLHKRGHKIGVHLLHSASLTVSSTFSKGGKK